MSDQQFDTRLSHVEQGLASIQATVDSNQRATLQRMDAIASAIDGIRNEGGHNQWLTKDVISVMGKTFIGLAVIIGGLAVGLSSYTNSEIDDSLAVIESSMNKIDNLIEFQTQTHYEVGRTLERFRIIEEKLEHFDKLDHVRDDRIVELEKRSSAAEVARRALGDYLKEHTTKEHP